MKYLFEKIKHPKNMKASFIEAVEDTFFADNKVAIVL